MIDGPHVRVNKPGNGLRRDVRRTNRGVRAGRTKLVEARGQQPTLTVDAAPQPHRDRAIDGVDLIRLCYPPFKIGE